MKSYLIIGLVFFAFNTNAQKTKFLQSLDTVQEYFNNQKEITKSAYKNIKKLNREEDTAVIKKKAKELLDTFKQSVITYKIINKKSLKVYESANAFTIQKEKSLANQDKSKEVLKLITTMEKVEEYSSNIGWKADENQELAEYIVEHLEKAIKSDFLEEIHEMLNEVRELCKENKSNLKAISKNIRTTEKYCLELSEFST